MKYSKILDGNVPKRKFGAEVVGGALAGGGALLSGLIGSSSSSSNVSSQLGAQSAENAKNRAWQTQEAEKARAFQQGVLNQQNQFSQQLQDRQAYYQSPVYQSEQLRQAGINPAVYFGQQSTFGGSSAPSAPSAPSPAQVGSVSGLNPVGFQPFGTNIGSILSGVGNVLQSSAMAKKLGIESDWLPEKLKKEVRLLDRQATLQQVLAVGQDIYNERQRSTMPYALKQASADLYKTLAEADLMSSKTQTEDSIRKVNYAIEEVQKSIKSLNYKEIEKLGLEMPYYVDLLQAKINDLKASASEHDASAGLKLSETSAQNMANDVRSYGLSSEKVATLSKWIAESDISDAKRNEALLKLKFLERNIDANTNEWRARFVATLYEIFNIIGINAGVSANVHN